MYCILAFALFLCYSYYYTFHESTESVFNGIEQSFYFSCFDNRHVRNEITPKTSNPFKMTIDSSVTHSPEMFGNIFWVMAQISFELFHFISIWVDNLKFLWYYILMLCCCSYCTFACILFSCYCLILRR